MNYKFVTGVSPEEYTEFLKTLGHCNFMQSPTWAIVKEDWKRDIVCVYEGEKIVAGAMLLIRKLPLSGNMIYSPRGFLCDFDNKELVKFMTENLSEYAKKIGACVVKIDPEIKIAEIYKGEKTEIKDGFTKMENLVSSGFVHQGFETDFYHYMQPRFNAEKPLFENGEKIDAEDLRQSFDKKLKKYIGQFTEKRGIFFEKSFDKSAVSEYMALSQSTEKRHDILLRDQKYFERIFDAYKDNAVIFFAKINLDKFIEFTEAEGGENKEEDLISARKLKEERGNIVDMSALFMLNFGDTAYLMYSGFDESVFGRFRSTNQLRYEAMLYYQSIGVDVFSFMGIDGSFSDTLSVFKLKFNPRIVEYAGEFELITDKKKYFLFKNVVPKLKSVYIKAHILVSKKKK